MENVSGTFFAAKIKKYDAEAMDRSQGKYKYILALRKKNRICQLCKN